MIKILATVLLLLCPIISFAQLADDSTINPITGEIDKIGTGGSGSVNWEDPATISALQTNTGWTSDASTKTVSSYNVGIGSATPAFKLDVAGIVNTSVGYRTKVGGYLESSVIKNPYGMAYAYIQFGRNAYPDKDIVFSANNADRMVITSTGNVGIGTTSPSKKLEVAGNAKIGSGVAYGGKTLELGGNVYFDTVVTPTNAQIQGMVLANGGAGAIEAGKYYYSVAFYTAEGDTGVEAMTYSGFPSITLSTPSYVSISNIPTSTDPRVIGRKIYRSQAGTDGDIYYLYYIGSITDNTTTTYTDNSARATTAADWIYNKNNSTSGYFYRDNDTYPIIRLGNFLTSIGNNAAFNATRATTFTALGVSAFQNLTTGDSGVAVGHNACSAVTTGAGNVCVGYASGLNQQTGSWNIAIGQDSLRAGSALSYSYNIAIGGESLNALVNGNSNNTSIGFRSGKRAQGSGGTYLGYYAGSQDAERTVGNYNTVVGANSGTVLGSGSNNFLAGYSVELALPNSSNQLNLGNVIYATGLGTGSTPSASGNVGIGTYAPTAQLNIKDNDTVPFQITNTLAGDMLTVTSVGNVGVGTSIPLYKLDVAGEARFKNYVDFGSAIRFSSAAGFGTMRGRSSVGLSFGANETLDMMVLATSGNLGLGTTLPLANLQVGYGNPSMTLTTALGANDALIKGRLEVDSTAYFNGYVGLGTSTPAQLLDVNGTVQATGIKLTTSPTNGYVLTSDADGVGTWQAATGGSGISGLTAGKVPKASSATTIVDSSIYENGGNIGIGTTEVQATLSVRGTTAIVGTKVSKTIGTVYQAETDGFVSGKAYATGATNFHCYTDASNPPTTIVFSNGSGNTENAGFSYMVKKGHYYKTVASAGGDTSQVMYWTPWGLP